MSRIDPIMKNLIGNENPDDLAQDILEVLTEGSNVPEAGNYYVFVYQPKTPNISCAKSSGFSFPTRFFIMGSIRLIFLTLFL